MLTGINHITLAVKNVETSFAFYKDLLQFIPLCKWDRGAYFLVGDFWFCLNHDEKRIASPCYTHYAFSVSDKHFELLSQKIISNDIKIFKENTSPGKSLYFLDPDGHKLEIHVDDWKTRLQVKKKELGTWKNVEWFI
ncbi:MAG: VOC family protein [Chlamydiales bacterium]|nr:VOC family protein [Chlamydiales bacterium]